MEKALNTKAGVSSKYLRNTGNIAKRDFDALIKENKRLQVRVREYEQKETERKKLEDALQESNELYRARFEESPISLWDKDYSLIRKFIDELSEKGVTDFREHFDKHPEDLEHCATLIRVTDVNNTTVRIYGAEDKEDFKNNLHKIFCDETWGCFRQEVLYVADNRNKREAETITKKFNGEKNNIMVKWQVPENYPGEPYSRILFSIVDITEKKRLEEEAKFIQTKLIHTNKMTSLGTLVSGVAHEVNNPNHYIMSNAELMSDIWQDALNVLSEHHRQNGDFNLGGFPFSEIEDVTQKLFKGINDGSKRISNIVSNLKNFSKPERTSLNGKVDLNKVITDAHSILTPQIKKFTENFNMQCSDNLPDVTGSPQQIEQVVINLLINALQALPNKTCGVTISTKRINGSVAIEVADEGTGIPLDILGKITEPFFTTKLDSGGTGLGLSISQAIIKEHKGSIDFTSSPGKGTIACIKLPVYK